MSLSEMFLINLEAKEGLSLKKKILGVAGTIGAVLAIRKRKGISNAIKKIKGRSSELVVDKIKKKQRKLQSKYMKPIQRPQ